MKKIFRIGTRGSPLALAQAGLVRDRLRLAHPELGGAEAFEIVSIRTAGDWRPEHREQTFLDLGGNKGLFTKEIEEALLAGAIDLAVHSMKDVPTVVPEGLSFAALLTRGDPRDAFLSPAAASLATLSPGARVGTSSLRRAAQVLALRPDLRVTPLRGNVETRLRKLEQGEAEATILALAGLERLGMAGRVTEVLDTETMLPAVAQGAIGLEIRSDDAAARALVLAIHDAATAQCIEAERALLMVLDGSCRTPIAALARLLQGRRLGIEALVASPDGRFVMRRHLEGLADDAAQIGRELGEAIKRDVPPDVRLKV